MPGDGSVRALGLIGERVKCTPARRHVLEQIVQLAVEIAREAAKVARSARSS